MKVSTYSTLRPGAMFPAGCSSRTLLDHVTSKWGVLILVALSEGPHRWSGLRQRAEGISEKMLAQTLKILERDGLVHREQQPVIPPRVDYSLTAKGHELTALLLPLFGWTLDNAEEIIGHQQVQAATLNGRLENPSVASA
ncbi:helix-turn-helix domain-containing protein [Pseudarthrobacter sp. PS3-L1]|uniref:winged helix-turn-helix transcriptional regulator n=1 Tax=Pseudarthrobacter sp. PS3-L1 TaxID=3046207 RepID=UPI0024BB272B|nr:helix-turn-helix domain-containing protein [Pseudarthrobacter sp. PS3-L1]MDJ0320652.1 helix-turn-helix domain-containing protein [Pseudarthrobacter sp. PS3-L1]